MSARAIRLISSQRVFPSEKWKAYVHACNKLSELKQITKEAARAIRLTEEEIEILRLELVEALDDGGVIERGGKL